MHIITILSRTRKTVTKLSIDGLRETHDWFRKPGSFDTTLEKIGCINRAGIRSVVMTTVSGKNIDEAPGIIDAVVAAGVNVFAFARYCPTSGEKDTGIAPLRYRRLLADCDKKFKEYEAAGCRTAGWAMCSRIGWPMCGSARWSSTGTTPALPNAPSVNCWPSAGAARL